MANKWTTLGNLPTLPNGFAPGTMILLTDGSVLVQSETYSQALQNYTGKEWFRLTPKDDGIYETGVWTGPFSMANARQFFASGILKDGRLFVLGGEYCDAGGNTTLAEIFDPTTNSWSALANPYSWTNGDCSACVLADGRVLFGSLGTTDNAIWNPATNNWVVSGTGFGSVAQTKQNQSDEEGWYLLPDGSVITVAIASPPYAEKYIPSTDLWVIADQVPATLNQLPLVTLNGSTVGEIGPAIFLPNGKLFHVGATGHTSLYTPPAGNSSQPGSWSNGADMPTDTSGNNINSVNGNIQTAIDAPAVLLTGGKVLCCVGNTKNEGGSLPYWSGPCNLVVYDPATNATPTALAPQPPNNGTDTWEARFLLLPTGQVLFSNQGNSISILTVDTGLLGAPQNSWKPTITNYYPTMNPGNSYTVEGYQFNGLSQACSYGDDAQMATNYPIVQFTNTSNSKIRYARSYNFSTMGIATGNNKVGATIEIPSDLAPGTYKMVVIANGIPSAPVNVTIVAAPTVYINGGYQSADIVLTDLTTMMSVPLGGMPGGPWDTLLQPTTQYGFSATIHNSTNAAVSGVKVSFWSIPGGVGTAGNLLTTVTSGSIPAHGSLVVPSNVNYTSPAVGTHLCAVVSLYNPATGCSVDPGNNALLIPDPGLTGDHECSAWRNTDSKVAGPHPAKYSFTLGFGRIPFIVKEPIQLTVETTHVPYNWRKLPGVAAIQNTLNSVGALSNIPLYMHPSIFKLLPVIDVKSKIHEARGGKLEHGAAGIWKFFPHEKGEHTSFEITGEVPAHARIGDILTIKVSAQYPEVDKRRPRTIEFLQFIHIV